MFADTCEMIIVLTFTTEFIGVTWNASPITMTSLFVTCCVVEAVSSTVVDTIISVCPVITFCKHKFFIYSYNWYIHGRIVHYFILHFICLISFLKQFPKVLSNIQLEKNPLTFQTSLNNIRTITDP